mmetsp:Transcript_30509/g.55213  ORF Transcript_30509/g.55213 Transcript_30509/m.55213 type:complete len:346 (-) Transcript_30509:453-1490(-)
MQREINEKAEMNGEEKEEAEAAVIVTSPAPSQLAQVQRLQQGEPTGRASEQDSVDSIERARVEARRESNRRSAKNGRIRQKLLLASLQDENQLLRAELGKALDRIDQLKRTLEFETQRALEHNRCVQLLVQNHLNDESPQIHERPLGTGTTSGTHTIPTGSTLSRLLETARSYDDPSLLPTSSSFRGNQGFSSRGSGGYSMTQHSALSNGHTSYKKPPNSTNGGLMYHNNVDGNGDYSTSGSYSTLGDAGHASDMKRATASTHQVESHSSNISTGAFPSSYKSTKYRLTENESIVNRNYTTYPLGGHNHAHGIDNSSTPSTTSAQLEHIDRLEQELKMLKRRVQG